MAARELTFDTGGREYVVNGARVRFDPSGAAFLEDFRTLVADLSVLQEELTTEMGKLYEGVDTDKAASDMDPAELEEAVDRGDRVIEVLREHDARMRETFDAGPFELVGGGSLSDAVFGERRALSENAGGQPLWVNFMACIANEIDAITARERKEAAASKPAVRDERYREMVERYRSRR